MPDSIPLTQFPRPSVAVDTAVLCPVPQRGLHVLLTRAADGSWHLPGTILRPQERLAEAVARCLRSKAQLVDRSPVQLHVFDQPDRDDRGWVISVAHLDVLTIGDEGLDLHSFDDSQARKMVPVTAVSELSAEHQEIVRVAVHRLRSLHERTPDPFGLLGEEFSLRQLRSLHEIVTGEPLQADTFRRTMLPMLEPTGRALTQGRGRPAQTFTRRRELVVHPVAEAGIGHGADRTDGPSRSTSTEAGIGHGAGFTRESETGFAADSESGLMPRPWAATDAGSAAEPDVAASSEPEVAKRSHAAAEPEAATEPGSAAESRVATEHRVAVDPEVACGD